MRNGIPRLPSFGWMLIFLVVVCLFGPVRAQEQEVPSSESEHVSDLPGPSDPPGDIPSITRSDLSKGEYILRSGQVESWLEGKTRITYVTGGVEILRKGERLSAETVIGWSLPGDDEEKQQTDQSGPRSVQFDRLYAEGKVLRVKKDQYLKASKFFLNTRTEKGVAKDVTYRTYNKKRGFPFVVRAEKLVQTKKNSYTASNVNFTTCEFANPHFDVYSDTVDIEKGNETDISVAHLVPQFQKAPLGYWPFLFLSSRMDLGPLKNVEYGNNDRFDQFVKTLWGFDFSKVKKNKQGNPVRDEEGNRVYEYKFETLLNIDWRNERGWGGGPNIDYKIGRNHEGWLDAYYLHDFGGPNPELEFDRQFLPQIKEDRGRANLFHRYDMIGNEGDTTQLRLDTELDVVSDRHFMEEFFEDEFKTDKEEETYTYLRYVNDNTFSSGLYRYRANSFQSQTEYLPGFSNSIQSEPIDETPFLYSSETDIANLRDRPSDQTDDPSFRSGRLDTYQEIAYPFSIGPVQSRIFTGGRFSLYEHGANSNDALSRQIYSGGIRFFDQLHRGFPLESTSLGLDGLRHIFTWDVRYTNNIESTRQTEDIHRFDDNDPLGEFEEVYLEVRNRFETRDWGGRENETSDSGEESGENRKNKSKEASARRYQFLDVGAAIEYYPDASRDTVRAREQNFLEPFAWIPSVNDTVTNEVKGDQWSLLNLDFEFTPDIPLSVDGDFEVNPENSAMEASRMSLKVSPASDVNVKVGYSYVRDLTETTSWTVNLNFSDHWGVQGSTSYDLIRKEFQNRRLSLVYTMHDFKIMFSTIVDDQRDNDEFALMVVPKFASFPLIRTDTESQEIRKAREEGGPAGGYLESFF